MHPHRLDPVSLIAGLVFVLVGITHLLGGSLATWFGVLRIWPLVLVAAGVAVLAGVLRRPDDT